MFQISQRARRFSVGKLFMIFPIKKLLLKDVSLDAVSFNALLAGFSPKSDLNDWCIVLVFLVVILEGKQRLDEVPVLVFDVFGLPPLFPSFVV